MPHFSRQPEFLTMAQTPLDYTAAGVDYSKIDPLKILAQKAASATAGNLSAHGVSEILASRGESAYVMNIGGTLIASITECLGTKALVADAVRMGKKAFGRA
mgnify:FL=1